MHDTGGTYFSTHFWTNCIDRVSPHAHGSRIGRTRALVTCVMADPRALYGTCSRRQTCAPLTTLCYCTEQGTNIPLATLCYRTEQGMNGHILLSVHGFAITSYLRSLRTANVPSPLWPAKLRSGGSMLYSLGHVDAHGPGVLASAGRGRPSGCVRLTLPSAGHQGTAQGFVQCDSWHGVRCG